MVYVVLAAAWIFGAALVVLFNFCASCVSNG